MMTESQMWETFAAFDALGIRHIANRACGTVTIERQDLRTGHIITRTLTSVPTSEEARTLVADMDRELRARARRTRTILRAERALDAE